MQPSDADRLAESWSNLKYAIIESLSTTMLPIVEALERWLTPRR